MPSSIIFIGSGFQLQSVHSETALTVRVRYTSDPMRANPANANDATNPSNYTLAGPSFAVITGVNSVSGDTQSLDLNLNAPLSTGTWSLTVNSAVESDSGDPISAPLSITFAVTSTPQASVIGPGSYNDDALDVLKKHFSPAFSGPGWEAILAAVASGDAANWTNARYALDQLHICTADEGYLDQRAADRGVIRPAKVGMSDDIFRKFAIRSSNKVVLESIWEMLETFYSHDSVSGWLETSEYSPYALADGDTLTFVADHGEAVTVTFLAEHFQVIGAATDVEVAAVITRECRRLGSTAYATSAYGVTDAHTRVRLYSGTLGMMSAMQVIGGTAQNALNFDSRLAVVSSVPIVWNVTQPTPTTLSFETSSTDVQLYMVEAGDYVNLQLASLSVKGTYPITDVVTSYAGGFSQTFTIECSESVIAGAFGQVAVPELYFYRPTTATVLTNERGIAVAQNANGVSVTMPATTEAVSRTVGFAAYAKANSDTTVIESSGHTNVTVECTHEIDGATGQVFLDGFVSAIEKTPSYEGFVYPIGVLNQDLVREWNKLGDPAVDHRQWALPVLSGERSFILTGGLKGVATYAADTLEVTMDDDGLTYTYATKAALWDAVYDHAGVQIPYDGPSYPLSPVVVGGTRGGPLSSSTVQAFNVHTQTWDYMCDMNQTKSKLKAVWVPEEGGILCGPGFDGGGDLADCDVVIPAEEGWISNVISPVTLARNSYGMVALPGEVLVCGGTSSALADGTTSTCEIYDVATHAWGYVGQMTYCRQDHACVLMNDGRVMVAGGTGFLSTTGDHPVGAPLRSAEVYSPSTMKWSPLPDMPVALSFANGVLLPDGNVLVCGESGHFVFNVVTGKWEVAFSNPPDPTLGSSVIVCNTMPFVVHGGMRGIIDAAMYAMVPGQKQVGVAHSSGLYTADAVGGAHLLLHMPGEGYMVKAEGTCLAFSAQAGTVPGPISFDPEGALSITGITTVTTETLKGGVEYNSILVSDTADFPDSGLIALAVGHEEVAGPISYSGKLSATELKTDGSFTLPNEVLVGSSVTYLPQKGPFLPDAAGLGALWVTPSGVGRLLAAETIVDNLAAGVNVDVEISYPSDRGLGNEGYPVKGQNKLSDIISVFGGDNLDDEIQDARGT